MSVHRWHAHLAERVATIDVQTTAGYKHPAESEQGERPRPWMAPVESADPHGESDVVALLTAIEFELLSRGLAGGQTSGGDQLRGRLAELGDRLANGRRRARGRTDRRGRRPREPPHPGRSRSRSLGGRARAAAHRRSRSIEMTARSRHVPRSRNLGWCRSWRGSFVVMMTLHPVGIACRPGPPHGRSEQCAH